MSVKDIIKKSVLENFSSADISTTEICVVLLFTILIAIYIYICYRIKTRNVFYSKEFGVSLIAISLIVSAIILTIQQSIVVSLGMVGALSIVRFRTAIKNPLDLVFLFWSISVGIICGAGLTEIAVLASIIVTFAIFVFDFIPDVRKPYVLSVSYRDKEETEELVIRKIKEICKSYELKARSCSEGKVDSVYEIRVKENKKLDLSRNIATIESVDSVSLVSYDGDIML